MTRTEHDQNSVDEFFMISLPLTTAFIIALVSVYIDIKTGSPHWIQRSGPILAITGTWVGLQKNRWSFFSNNNAEIFINFQLWYRKLPGIYLIVGALFSSYGDLLVASINK